MQSNEIQPQLLARLLPVIQKVRVRRVFLAMAMVMLGWALLGLLFAYCIEQRWVSKTPWFWSAFLGIGVGVALVVAWIASRTVNVQAVAHKLEQYFPELNASLLTALEQDSTAGKLSFLQQDVIRTAIYHSYEKPWDQVVPVWHWLGAPAVSLVALVALALSTVFLARAKPIAVPTNEVSFESVEVNTSKEFKLTVEPGDTEIEKGTNLLVLARFANEAPAQAELVVRTGEKEYRIQMNKGLDDPVFGGRVSGIEEDSTYWIEYAEKISPTFRLSVFEYPELIGNKAILNFPPFAQAEPKVMTNVRRISAVVGSFAELELLLNKPVVHAELKTKEGDSVDIVPDPTDRMKWQARIPFDVVGSKKYELHLRDEAERTNPTASRLVINVNENRLPKLQLLKPSRDVQVSAVEELGLKAKIFDDFGLKRVGLTYSIGDEEREIELQLGSGGNKNEIEAILDMEAINAEVDQLIAYYFWAEDQAADGETRRVSSDMFFAEIRPFDEVYRKAQPGAGQQGQQGQQQGQQAAGGPQGDLEKLQKEIVNAAWNVLRREVATEVSKRFESDVELLVTSQNSAIEQLAEAESEDVTTLQEIRSFMTDAATQFSVAGSNEDRSALKLGMNKARRALQRLLSLRSKENNVTQQQQQQQSSSSSQSQSRQQQQLQQMEMTQDENRYEQERTAEETEQESEEERQNRQILNRLSELARRQKDLNERVKDLTAALLEAKTPEEKEELEKELKRLREEQQKIADDLDEVSEKMEQSANQEAMAEPREDVEQARENAQQTADALKNRKLSQATAEGRRAEENLETLKEEFQNRSSEQFRQQMQEMRNEAQELERDEKELAEQLKNEEQETDTRPSLRESGNRSNLEEELKRNAERVRELKDQMKETIEVAEESQPLLAEELYDTFRDVERRAPDQLLESAARSVRNGFSNDAQTEEANAREGLRELREGIEKAAESVLGDDQEALESARNRLRNLTRELENEVESEDPSAESQDTDQQARSGARRNSEAERDADSDGQNPGKENTQRSAQGENGSETDEPNQQDQNQANPNQPGSRSEQSQEGEPGEGQGQAEQDRESDTQNRQGQGRRGQENGERANEGQAGDGNQERGERSESGREGRRSRRQLDAEFRRLGDEGPQQENLGGNANQYDRDARPLTGDEYLDWVDKLRDVESMVPDADLRAEIARIREKARDIRKDVKRHSKDPNWQVVRKDLVRPLYELQDRVTEELIRRSNKNATLPIERQQVPKQYKSAVQKYFEELGTK